MPQVIALKTHVSCASVTQLFGLIVNCYIFFYILFIPYTHEDMWCICCHRHPPRKGFKIISLFDKTDVKDTSLLNFRFDMFPVPWGIIDNNLYLVIGDFCYVTKIFPLLIQFPL